MIYLNEKDIDGIGIDWEACTSVIEEAVKCLHKSDFAQPIKPYLRFKNLANRIIAMPAYIGDKFDIAGIKWIASFPGNIDKGLPRASSVTVLNDSNTGQIVSIINTNKISVIRTVSVSALMMRYYFKSHDRKNLTVGIIGFGPIGQYHYKMCQELYANRISKIIIFDIKGVDTSMTAINSEIKTEIANDWQSAYKDSDVVINCTVSKETYMDLEPKPEALLLNVSLRDYKPEILKYTRAIIVDDWDEVCRENTDIEVFHKKERLRKENTKSIVDVVVNKCLDSYPPKMPVMFNPMGMGIFDVAMAKHYYDLASTNGVGQRLEQTKTVPFPI